jgi:gliding motility associated protien GldN
MKYFFSISFILTLLNPLLAQLPGSSTGSQSNVLDGVYIQEHIPTKRLVPYSHLREADVMWSHRIWRVLDLKEKMNHKLYYPLEPQNDRISLFDVIKYAATKELSITLYDPGIDLDDKFRNPIEGDPSDQVFKDRLEKMFGYIESKDSVDANDDPVKDDNGDIIQIEYIEPYLSSEIVRYVLKEDWFFDKQRSMLDVRIIGIAPVVLAINPVSKQVVGLKKLFWLYFPGCRKVFNNSFVYNPDNDAQRMSFDDLFRKREFSSFVEKESNVFDRSVGPNWTGIDALLESERIREEIFTFEHDLWHF